MIPVAMAEGWFLHVHDLPLQGQICPTDLSMKIPARPGAQCNPSHIIVVHNAAHDTSLWSAMRPITHHCGLQCDPLHHWFPWDLRISTAKPALHPSLVAFNGWSQPCSCTTMDGVNHTVVQQWMELTMQLYSNGWS